MNFNSFISQLTERLSQPLPGQTAHLQMIPMLRLPDYQKGYDLTNARQSSVLVLLYPTPSSIVIPFIRRPTYDGVHSGQIGLPGGKIEPQDSSVEAAALRETQEEIGVNAKGVIIIGKLSSVYIPPSQFLVNVIVGYYQQQPAFIKDDYEVEEIIHLSVEDLLNDLNLSKVEVTNSQGLTFEAPCFRIDTHIIWGATAMIINEFRWLIRELQLETKP